MGLRGQSDARLDKARHNRTGVVGRSVIDHDRNPLPVRLGEQ
jgi:hypothetical protein